ncbi:MAG: type III-B CRISPR module RAMP protein Cmr6 [Ktedonobacteraceae bacterium]
MTYYLPDPIARLVANRMPKCKNLGLILDKFPPSNAIGGGKGKGDWFREIVPEEHVDFQLTEHAYKRWFTLTSSEGTQRLSAVTDWRMVIGLGGETVLETDLTLHHVYGIPYIPGSALKGLTRAYAAGEKSTPPSSKIENDSEQLKRIFGSQDHAGTVIFFDAMPKEGRVKFALDIMNPHYPRYYSDKRPPTNDQDPNPITFLTVTDTTFAFALAPRNPANSKHQADVNQAIEWLEEALKQYGVGGKTSAGYGYFKNITRLASSADTTQISRNIPPSSIEPEPYIRPRIPVFRPGQDITGSVVAPTDDLRRIAPPDARAFLRYQSFATKEVLMVISAEEAQSWKPGETRICVFVREEVHDGCTVLVGQPRVKKK